nr:unnamed protein product [Callosobruchus analis]
MQRLKNYNVKINERKCVFYQNSIEFLGHKIDEFGIHPTNYKIECIEKAPTPENLTQLKSYLGLLNYYGKFIPMLSSKLKPLYDLCKSGVEFIWTDECENTFQMSKKLITSEGVLTHFSPSLPIYVSCDASGYGVGAVLSHHINGEEKPVLFASSTLSAAEKLYSNLERESLAIIFALKKFHKYIFGRKFVLLSDHQPLQYIFGRNKGIPVTAASRITLWAITLSAYDYDIQYKKGKLLANADGLSRLPMSSETQIPSSLYSFNLIENIPLHSNDISKATIKDLTLVKVIDHTKSGWPSTVQNEKLKPFFLRRNELSVENNCLLLGNRVIIPEALQNEVLELFHEQHLGIVRTKMLIRAYCWWPNINNDIEKFISLCEVCQTFQNFSNNTTLSWPAPTNNFFRVHIDFFHKDDYTFLILVDDKSKWLDVKLMQNGTNAKNIILKLKETFAIFGLPVELVSDNGPPFNSQEFIAFCQANGIKPIKSPPYHPQSNGLAERNVQTVKKQHSIIYVYIANMDYTRSIESFNPKDNDITSYLERLEQLFICNNVAEEKKVAMLLTLIGGEAYCILKDLLAPTLPSEKTYAELGAELKRHYSPKRLTIAERYNFYTAFQNEEDIRSFVSCLKGLAKFCDFGSFLDDALRDRLVCGVKSDAIKRRITLWAITLSAYDYDIQYKKGKLLANADGLSRLPMSSETQIPSSLYSFNLIENIPLHSNDISKATIKDLTLVKVIDHTKSGWPSTVQNEKLKPFFLRRNELSVENNCLLLGNRVIIPEALQNEVLELFHEQHLGIVRTKMLIRAYCWWPNINNDIEKFISLCEVCQTFQNFSNNTTLSWPAPTNNFFRVHIDFFHKDDYTFLILVDDKSKWLDVKLMQNGTNAKNIILKLKETFAIFGLPVELVSDNGPPFNSQEFIAFCQANGIKPIKSPPYHPQSNGLAERNVQTVKKSLEKALFFDKKGGISTYILKTRISPSENILKVKPRTRFDLLKPCSNKAWLDSNSDNFRKTKLYTLNQPVYVKNKQLKVWQKARVVKVLSFSTYLVQVNNVIRHVHSSDIRTCLDSVSVSDDHNVQVPLPHREFNSSSSVPSNNSPLAVPDINFRSDRSMNMEVPEIENPNIKSSNSNQQCQPTNTVEPGSGTPKFVRTRGSYK